MEIQNAKVEASELLGDEKARCSQECLADKDAQVKCKRCHDENCRVCKAGLSSNHMATLGVAACVGFLLGWILEKKK